MSGRSDKPRVVLTSVGVSSPWGFTPQAVDAALAPPSTDWMKLDDDDLTREVARFVGVKDRRRFNRLTRIGVQAAMACIAEAGIVVPEERRDDYGAIFGCAFGPVSSSRVFVQSGLAAGGLNAASPLVFPYTVGNATPGVITMMLGWRGVNSTVSGYNPLLYAFDLLLDRQASGILVGGMEEVTEEMADACRHRRGADGRALPALAPLSEGAVMVLLETLEAAQARAARALLELHGAGQATSLADEEGSFDHLSEVTPEAVGHAASQALDDAGIDVAQIGTLVSLARDERQAAAEQQALVGLGARPGSLRVLAPKQVLGESFGASETFALLYALRHAPDDAQRPYILLNGHQVGGALSALVLTRCPAGA